MAQEDTGDCSLALYELENTLSCPSCGKVEDLQTHVECGGVQCSTCWQQRNIPCPSCRQQGVEETSLWDLGRILTLNAQRVVDKPDAPVNPFEFLKVLRDFIDECKENDDTNAHQQEKEKSPKKAAVEAESPQEKLVARNSFGGLAFYAGDQSGITTGRVGRRRLERQEAPIRHESFDDSMFDFHSQSSMPASQAAAASQEALQQASESAHNSQLDAETGSQMEETRSQQQEDEHGANVTMKDDGVSQTSRYIDSASFQENHESLMASRRETEPVSNDSEMTQADSKQESKDGPGTAKQTGSLQDKNKPPTNIKEKEDAAMNETKAATESPPKPSRRRVTIQSPLHVSAHEPPTRDDYYSTITPASTGRIRLRTESPCLQQSPEHGTEMTENMPKDLHAELETAQDESLTRPLKEGDVDSDTKVSDNNINFEKSVQEKTRVAFTGQETLMRTAESQESQNSVESVCLPESIDLYGLMHSQGVSLPKSTESSEMKKSPQIQDVATWSVTKYTSIPRPSESKSDNRFCSPAGDDAGSHHAQGLELQRHVGGGQKECLDGKSESILDSGIASPRHGTLQAEPMEDSQQTTVSSQALPDTCDFWSLVGSKEADRAANAHELVRKEKGAENEANACAKDDTDRNVEGSIQTSLVHGFAKKSGVTFSDSNGESTSLDSKIDHTSASLASSSTRLDRDSQELLNSQYSIASQLLPTSDDFHLLIHGLLRSRSVAMHTANIDKHDSSKSTERGDDDAGDETAATNDECRVHHELRHEINANASIDKDIQRSGETGPIYSDTQQTLMPSQHLPDTCDFQSLLFDGREESSLTPEDNDDALQESGASSDKQLMEHAAKRDASRSLVSKVDGDIREEMELATDKSESGEGKADISRVDLEGEALTDHPVDSPAAELALQEGSVKKSPSFLPPGRKFRGRENVSAGSHSSRLSRHSRSDSDETRLDESDTDATRMDESQSSMMPAIQDLSGLLRSHSSKRTSQPTSASGSQEVPTKVATHANAINSPEQGYTEMSSSTQQTWMLSQQLPDTCDFQLLFRDGSEPKMKPKEAAGSTRPNLKEKSTDEITSGREYIEGRDELASQGSVYSQHLPNTCDFGNLLTGTSVTSHGSEPSDNIHSVSKSSSKPLRIVLDKASEECDFQRLRQLCEAGVCKADERVSSSTTHYIPYTKSSPISDTAKVCLPTLEYYKALVLGVSVVDSKWLQDMQADRTCCSNEDDHRVWGDSGLCGKVIALQNGSSEYTWLKSTAWWTKKCGPAQLRVTRSMHLLEGYCILVPEQAFPRPPEDVRDEPSRESSLQDVFKSSTSNSSIAEDPHHFEHLARDEIMVLCMKLGAKVVQTETYLASSDETLTRLVLIPATVPLGYFSTYMAKQSFISAIMADNMQSFANTPKSHMVWALRSTWLTDTIAARFHAPLQDYSYGVLIHQPPCQESLSVDQRDRFVDRRRPSRKESSTDI